MRRAIGTLVVIGVMLVGAGPPTQVLAAGVIYACVKKDGAVRIVGPPGTCKQNETAMQWNSTGPPGPPGPAFPITCPPDSVLVGTTCIDKYEASVWQTIDAPTIAKIRDGTVTVADLGGATQRGVASDDYGAGCPDTGNGCVDLYAVSIPGVAPSAFLTWFQAAAAARNSGKRLPTNQEWQAAALGTPDPGVSVAGSQDCNTKNGASSGVDAVVPTGSRSSCVSDVGAFDMVGNLWEWVADWVPLSTACGDTALFAGDFNCLAGASTTAGPGALLRGGDFVNGTVAGVFAVNGLGTPSNSHSNGDVGFRAAR